MSSNLYSVQRDASTPHYNNYRYLRTPATFRDRDIQQFLELILYEIQTGIHLATFFRDCFLLQFDINLCYSFHLSLIGCKETKYKKQLQEVLGNSEVRIRIGVVVQ